MAPPRAVPQFVVAEPRAALAVRLSPAASASSENDSSDEEETTDDEKERSPTSVLEDKLDCLEDAVSEQRDLMDKILDSLASLDSF